MGNIDLSKLVTADMRAAQAVASTMATFQTAIQALVDAEAVSRKYNDGNALAGYVASTNPQWAAEATAFVSWRDQVWGYAYAELDKVQSGERAQPTVEAFLAELPAIEWPPA
ncbi:MAG: hypothetical protein WBA42_01355 [Mesorhizobium sp.]